MKMTEKQSKALQIVLGILGGAGIWFSIGAPFFFNINPEQYQNTPLGWLWIILFGAIMFTQRGLEKKFETRFVAFFRTYLITLIACLGGFIIYAVVNNISFFNS